MPTVQVTLHPRGLHPIAAARAWHLSREEGMPIRDVCAEVVNMSGNTPSVKAVWRAIRSVDAIQGTGAIPSTKYANCGRPRKLARQQEVDAVLMYF